MATTAAPTAQSTLRKPIVTHVNNITSMEAVIVTCTHVPLIIARRTRSSTLLSAGVMTAKSVTAIPAIVAVVLTGNALLTHCTGAGMPAQ